MEHFGGAESGKSRDFRELPTFPGNHGFRGKPTFPQNVAFSRKSGTSVVLMEIPPISPYVLLGFGGSADSDHFHDENVRKYVKFRGFMQFHVKITLFSDLM